AVSLHPVAVLLSVTAGSLAAGIVGALFAVPVAATLNTVVLYLHGRDKFPELGRDPEGLDRWLRAFEAGVVPVAEVAWPAPDRAAPDRAAPDQTAPDRTDP
ncbi:MAG TPA: AI-2E family transporter, partial [Actinotalea sp.]|nr:AI-2E family transporter [Actinotalea sp.]